MDGIATREIVAAVAMDEPQTAAKPAQAATVPIANPPPQMAQKGVGSVVKILAQLAAVDKGTHQHKERDHRHSVVGRDIEHLLPKHGEGCTEGAGVNLQATVAPPDQRLTDHIGACNGKASHAHHNQRKTKWYANKGHHQQRRKTEQGQDH
jgi:hypothetical protein